MKYVIILVLIVLVAALMMGCSDIKEVPVGDGGPAGGKVSLTINVPNSTNSTDVVDEVFANETADAVE